MTALKAKWTEMNWYRRVLLIAMAVEILAFFVAVLAAVNRPGLEYGGTLLYPRTEGETRVYEGKLDWKPVRFTVSPEGAVTYQRGEYDYGPYQVTVDPAAFPGTLGEHDGTSNLGLEIRQGDEVVFRGGYCPERALSLWDGDGEPGWDMSFSVESSGGEATLYVDGREVTQEEQYAPALSVLAAVALGPELTHRGSLLAWLGVTLIALVNVLQICFPGFFFRLSLWGHVRNVDEAEPSELYVVGEYIEWAVLALLCLVLYWQALRVIV